MAPRASNALKIGAAVAIVIAAGVVAYVRMRSISRGTGDDQAQVWFYDQSEKYLYALPRDTIPPDDGIGGAPDDAVRATVVCPRGAEQDAKKRRIAYLETYTPELHKLMHDIDAAHKAGKAYSGKKPGRNDPFVMKNTLVRREKDPAWYDMTTKEAAAIIIEWRDWRDESGKPLVVCAP